MKILYISPKIPYPISDGGKLRVFSHIKHLSKKHEITSLSFIETKKELENIGQLRKYCKVESVLLPKYKSILSAFFGLFSGRPLRISYFRNKKFAEKAKKLSRNSDLVIIQALRMAQYSLNPKITILDIVDTPSLQIKRALKYENFLWKIIWSLELPRIKRYERKIGKRFKTILFASKADKNAMGSGTILKNSIKIKSVKKNKKIQNNIMFLGNMEYPPNIDAVKYFIKEIFPIIKKEIKNAKFYIVGKNPEKVQKYAGKDVIVTGFVEDLSKFFSKCKVFAAPLRLGSGIQNKVLEALNYELPVVATSIVNMGVEALDQKEIFIADNPKDFAGKVINLLKKQKLRDKLALSGKKFLRENYSPAIINKKLDKIAGKYEMQNRKA